jgi:hypothetical protein
VQTLKLLSTVLTHSFCASTAALLSLQPMARVDASGYYYPLLNVLHDRCDLLSLVRLGCGSKVGRGLVAAVVHNHFQETVTKALQGAAAPDTDNKRVEMLKWLLDAARQHQQQQQHHHQQQQQQQHELFKGLAGLLDAGGLLMVPHVPAAAAQALIAAGLLITKQQLLDAARAQVVGLEVWLQAHGVLGVPNVLLPGWAHAICCDTKQVCIARLHQLSAAAV